MPVTAEHPKRAPKPQRRGSSRNVSSNNVANPKLVLTQKEITNYVNHLPPHLKELDILRGKRNGSTQVNTIAEFFATSLTVPRSIPAQVSHPRTNPPSTTHSRPLSRTGSTQRIHSSRASSRHAARTAEVVGNDPGGDEDEWMSSESAMASPAPEPQEDDDGNDPKPLIVNQLRAALPSTLIPPPQPQMQSPAAKGPPGLALNEAHGLQFVGGGPTLAQAPHSNGAPYRRAAPPPPDVPGSAMLVTQSPFPEEVPRRPSQAVIDRHESPAGDESEGDTGEEDDDDDGDSERSRGPELRGRSSGTALARAQRARAPQPLASMANRHPRVQQTATALDPLDGRTPFPQRATTPTPAARNRDPQLESSWTASPVIGRRNGTAHDPSKRHSFQPGQLPLSVYAFSPDQIISPPTRPKRHSTTSRPVSSHGHNSPLNLLVRIPGQQVPTPSPLTAPPAVSRTTSDNATQGSEHAFQAFQDLERIYGRGLKKKGSVSSISSAATVPVGKSPPTAIREDVIATIIPLSKTSPSSSSTAMLSNLAQKRHSTTSTAGPFAGLTIPGFGYGHQQQQPHPRDSGLPNEPPLVSQFYPPKAWGPHVFSLLGTEDLRRHLTATMYRQPMTEAYERVCAARPSATHNKRT